MKKLIFILIIILSLNSYAQFRTPADSTGTQVFSAIRPNSQKDNIATAYTNEIRGGLHNYQTWQELQNIKSSRLVKNMFATVEDSAKLYQYNGVGWNEFSSGVSKDYADGNYIPYSGTLTKSIDLDLNGNELLFTQPDVNIEMYEDELFLSSTEFGGIYISNQDKAMLFNKTDILIDGNPLTFEGLGYSSDFSANYTERSLIDRGYADKNYLQRLDDVINKQITDDGNYVYFEMPSFSFEDDGGAIIIDVNTACEFTIKGDGIRWDDYSDSKINILGMEALITKGYADINYQTKFADTTYTDVINITRDQSPNYAVISHDGTWLNINTGGRLSISAGTEENNYYRIHGGSTNIRASQDITLSIDDENIVSLNPWGTGLIYDGAYNMTNPTDQTLISRKMGDERYLRAQVRKLAGDGSNKFWGVLTGNGNYSLAYPSVSVYRKSDKKLLINGTDYEIETNSSNQIDIEMTVAPAIGDTIVLTIITP